MKREAYAQSALTEDRHWWYCARRKIVAAIVRTFLHRKDALILDIGCGTGGNIPMLSHFGSVTGIDYHATAIAYCKQRGFPNVFQQDATRLQFSDCSFDLVCSLDVLNGIEEDREAVTEALRVTKPGGLVLITVAADPSLWGVPDVLSEHKRRYSRPAFLQFFTHQSCEILKFTSFNTFLYPVAYLQRVLERRSLIQQRPETLPVPLSPLNVLLYHVFSTERFLLRFCSFPYGVSLLALVRKK